MINLLQLLTYAIYSNYIDTLLGYSSDSKETWMKYAMLFHESDPGQGNDLSLRRFIEAEERKRLAEERRKQNETKETAAKKQKTGDETMLRDGVDEGLLDAQYDRAYDFRNKMYSGGREVYLSSPLKWPLSQTKLCLVPNIDMRVCSRLTFFSYYILISI